LHYSLAPICLPIFQPWHRALKGHNSGVLEPQKRLLVQASEASHSVVEGRASLLRRLVPEGVPLLWCPPLTHYDHSGAIDASRMAAHFRHISPFVRGFLIPGSTGDGWELSDAERRKVLAIALDQAPRLKLRLLIGALKANSLDAAAMIMEDLDWIKSKVNERDTESALVKACVCGFTVCPPRGKDLSQEKICNALASILEIGLPTAIYQLPQVTQNEMSPEVASDLATRFANFVFFKDTSSSDRVALSGRNLRGVFTTRGAEGDYARWLNATGGPYNGFLLGSANCFARELHQVIGDISAGRLDAARKLSDRLTAAVQEVFSLVKSLPDGNAFANANKAMDHFFAHGPRGATAAPPRLHAGSSLPINVIRQTEEILLQEGLMPEKGYME
jgi:dihydrodipicolinate synthase/N-acetylneuraminate lyase